MNNFFHLRPIRQQMSKRAARPSLARLDRAGLPGLRAWPTAQARPWAYFRAGPAQMARPKWRAGPAQIAHKHMKISISQMFKESYKLNIISQILLSS